MTLGGTVIVEGSESVQIVVDIPDVVLTASAALATNESFVTFSATLYGTAVEQVQLFQGSVGEGQPVGSPEEVVGTSHWFDFQVDDRFEDGGYAFYAVAYDANEHSLASDAGDGISDVVEVTVAMESPPEPVAAAGGGDTPESGGSTVGQDDGGSGAAASGPVKLFSLTADSTETVTNDMGPCFGVFVTFDADAVAAWSGEALDKLRVTFETPTSGPVTYTYNIRGDRDVSLTDTCANIDVGTTTVKVAVYGQSGAQLSTLESIDINALDGGFTLGAGSFTVAGDIGSVSPLSLVVEPPANLDASLHPKRVRLCHMGATNGNGDANEVCTDERQWQDGGVAFLLDPRDKPNGLYTYYALVDVVQDGRSGANRIYVASVKTAEIEVTIDLTGVSLEAASAQVSPITLAFDTRRDYTRAVLVDVTDEAADPVATDAVCENGICTLSVATEAGTTQHRYRMEVTAGGETWTSNVVAVAVQSSFIEVLVDGGACTLRGAIALTNSGGLAEATGCTSGVPSTSDPKFNYIALSTDLDVSDATLDVSDDDATVFPVITGRTYLFGKDYVAKIDKGDAYRRFLRIAPGAVVHIENVYFRQGEYGGYRAESFDGGCLYNEGDLELDRVTFFQCRASSSAGEARGGSVYSNGPRLSLSYVNFYYSKVESPLLAQGGALFVKGGELRLSNVVSGASTAKGDGGGVAMGGSIAVIDAEILDWKNIEISTSTVFDAKVQYGGGLYLSLGEVEKDYTLGSTTLYGATIAAWSDTFSMGGGLYLAIGAASHVDLVGFDVTASGIYYWPSILWALGGGAAFEGLGTVKIDKTSFFGGPGIWQQDYFKNGLNYYNDPIFGRVEGGAIYSGVGVLVLNNMFDSYVYNSSCIGPCEGDEIAAHGEVVVSGLTCYEGKVTDWSSTMISSGSGGPYALGVAEFKYYSNHGVVTGTPLDCYQLRLTTYSR